MSGQVLRVAVLGAGTVGREVIRALTERRDELAVDGRPALELSGIAVRDVEAAARRGLPAGLLTDAPAHLLASGEADVVVELMGGEEPARTLIAAALGAGLPVVTANKHVLAHHGPELESIARRTGAALRFEASVGGGIPVLGPLARDLAGNRVAAVRGIVNGTTNYILTAMTDEGRDYDAVLALAQAAGYAEADPSGDVEGHDAVNKLVILARLAFGVWLDPGAIATTDDAADAPGHGRPGITGVTADDIAAATSRGEVVKLLASASRDAEEDDGPIEARVIATRVAADSAFGRTSGVLNRIEVEASPVGTVAFSGPGAGGPATSSAVLGDLLAIAAAGREHVGLAARGAVGRRVGRAPVTAARPTLVERYRSFLPVTDATPPLTLGEGFTPLVRLERIGRRLGLSNLYAKVEGQNPTGSFKDRGMVVAVAKALETGASAIICASTGNTSASAAAYGARAGLEVVVVLPRGRIAAGKLLQATVAGARVVAVDGNFDAALRIVRAMAEQDDHPVTLVNSVNPHRLEGQKTAAFEICDDLGRAPDALAIPVGNAGNISAYWAGFRDYATAGIVANRPRMLGFQAAGAAPLVLGRPIDAPETIATAIRIGNPASWASAEAARDESGGAIESVTDDEILAAYRSLAEDEGIFCEPSSATSLAGVASVAARDGLARDAVVVCVLTGSGLKDPSTAESVAAENAVIEAEASVGAVTVALGW